VWTGDEAALDEAVVALKAGKVVAMPTDTVYGLAVDPRCRGATGLLFALKRRPTALELPVLVSGVVQAEALGGPDGLSPVAHRLAGRFWPGSLTIVVPRRSDLGWDLGGDDGTIGLRCPAHAAARRLCERVGPLATTSANRHGEPPITTAAALAEEFGEQVTSIVDGGVCDATPSTVVDVTSDEVRCLRDGSVPWNQIRRFVEQI
jgi:tRNA threonylcarbamoyl adenosine modification protein (Sua5/YciO/YrdC/YwlC family)